MKDERIEKISIEASAPIMEALRMMDTNQCKLLIVRENGRFYSLLSIGDIQRAIIANKSLEASVKTILRDSVKVYHIGDSKEAIAKQMRERRNEFMPILDDDGEIVDVIFWSDLFPNKITPKTSLNLPVVIMAGGEGTRLRPLTNILPKPLIPIGKQTMLEDIMDRFVDYGCNRFFVSVNYKADFIRRYFSHLDNKHYDISFFEEDKPLGTAGSLSLLKGKMSSTFFVSNCDSIIDQDYAEIIDFHRKNQNEITIIAAIKNYYIPYGTLETKEDGVLAELREKPELTFKINTGMYVLEPHLLDEIPEDTFFHITYLIDALLKQGRKVGVFPISEGSWVDIGNWDEYLAHIK